jgi:ABC transporter substrate binding protein (PQQ-dependent alcohol dehydrogenase system)
MMIETKNAAPGRRTGVAVIQSLLAASLLLASMHIAAADAEIDIGYLHRAERKETISLLDMPAPDNGLAGAKLGVEDDNTTGKFLSQHFNLKELRLGAKDDAGAAAKDLSVGGVAFILADLPPDQLLAAADAGRTGLLLNVVHTAPTRSMLADGLAQYLVWKQWRRWLLVVGSHDNDKLYADALRRAAARFGAKIVQERVFEDTGGARRTDSGIVQIQRQIPVFTQQAPAYDVLVAADEGEVFAAYLPYRTWDPRPVAGSAGLVPTSWDASHDQWGAVQLQNRFMKSFSRRMTALDMQAWMAVRMIGESASRTHAGDAAAITAFLKGRDFALAAFKGQKLTLRDWNFQLRQPILLADGRTVVSVSPQEGFLHPVTELDTLGYDRPETKCRLQ